MEYEQMLEEAYENVKVTAECERFEILNVAGHHEGTRTVISNFVRVVQCIRRNPEHLMKFLTKELASQGEIKGDRLILSRKLASKDVNDKIRKYVERFVLCAKCKKPDTELSDEDGKLYLRCMACGGKIQIHRI
ncbi:MAG: translation initiation factor IF-2 subunit beta [Nanoarchaeota archaeon]|nr:translation initiation factor IF-2 subunit beta [Nanoarchaeota archaeon]